MFDIKGKATANVFVKGFAHVSILVRDVILLKYAILN